MASIEETLARFASLHVVVVGDVMLDRFVYGDVNRISPEAPTPVIAARRSDEMLGGAGNVAVNIAALGARCTLVGVVGSDEAAGAIRKMADADPLLSDALVVDPARCTTLKMRFVSPHHNTHLLRADWEVTTAVAGTAEHDMIARIERAIAHCDAVVVSDYRKGALTEGVLDAVMRHARERGLPVVVDPKGLDYTRYKGATIVTPNHGELAAAINRPLPQDDVPAIDAGARELLARTGAEVIAVKRSEYGAQIVPKDAPSTVIAPAARRVVDVSGAGDTFVAALTLAIAAGASTQEAGRIGNAASGLAVEKRGTASASLDELRAFLIPRPAVLFPRKIVLDWDALKAQRKGWRSRSLTVGFTNGCFDLLHPGHVFLLSEARSRVDRLIVALNADDSVKRLKGPRRPVQPEAARLAVMAALESVDVVTLFAQDTPYELIDLLEPDVLFKGADYKPDQVVGHDIIGRTGGRVELIEFLPDNSTTGIVARIAETNEN